MLFPNVINTYLPVFIYYLFYLIQSSWFIAVYDDEKETKMCINLRKKKKEFFVAARNTVWWHLRAYLFLTIFL